MVFKNELENKLFNIASQIKSNAIDKEKITIILREFIENE
jgi:hypothetical protein